ncbi:MAG: alanine/glycine:cation symporter family protein [Tunicatimonas sp.]|uniref:alanine/glycine:cation symporter family protein n=1 Tax=Tunicatimonas sp. TaxID=1940096 RepID=UPI003C789889
MRKTLLLTTCLLLTQLSSFGQAVEERSIDETIDSIFTPISNFATSIIFYPLLTIQGVEVPFILLWLIIGAVFFTFYLNFINIRGFKTAIDIVKGKYTKADDPGEVTHFQALATALSGTVGLGNIAGVAVAISMGGPGATFWMIIFGLFSMSSKFVECALGVRFRDEHADGTVSGGAMYYLRKGLAQKGMGRLGIFLAGFFAVMTIGASFAGGNMFQINQAAEQVIGITGGEDTFLGQQTWAFGLIVAVLVGIVIIGGIQSIARVTEKIVPFMCGIYLISAIAVIIVNIGQVPEAFARIVEGAIGGNAMAGGLIGTLIVGMQRATFSNEAGVGSAAIAHSAVKTSEPVTEGFVASLEPFVDTVVVCTMTALVIVISGLYEGETDGISLTSDAFATVISWFPYVLAIAVLLFAFSTMISWSYYGVKAWTYIFGDSPVSVIAYKVIFCGFIVIGASVSLEPLIGFGDGMLFAMSLPNIIGCYILVPLVKKDMQSFLRRIKEDEIEVYK